MRIHPSGKETGKRSHRANEFRELRLKSGNREGYTELATRSCEEPRSQRCARIAQRVDAVRSLVDFGPAVTGLAPEFLSWIISFMVFARVRQTTGRLIALNVCQLALVSSSFLLGAHRGAHLRHVAGRVRHRCVGIGCVWTPSIGTLAMG
jgi:hypothetical protein